MQKKLSQSHLIPPAFIDQLIAQADIVDIISKRIDLRHKGKNFQALCPFHNEKTPSFTVNQDKQLYYCFGCGAGGNAINFLMAYDHLNFMEAIEHLAFSLGIELPKSVSAETENVQDRDEIFALLNKVARYYAKQLRETQVAIDYLKTRQLEGVTAKKFAIGYAPLGWDNLAKIFPDASDQKKLLETGLLLAAKAKPRNVDRFHHRIMFPIRDRRGRVVGFGGRVINKEDQPKYLNSPESAVFHKSQILYGLYEARREVSALNRLIVVEGYMDVVVLSQFGVMGAVATLGTAISAEHIKQMLRLVNEIIFCFDGDAAGRRAAQRALEVCLPLWRDGLFIRFLFLPEGEDPDSLVQKEGKAAFEDRMLTALTLSDYLMSTICHDIDLDSLEGRTQIFTHALPWLEKLPECILRELLVKKLSDLCGIEQKQMLERLKKTTAIVQQPVEITPLKSTNKTLSAQSVSGLNLVTKLIKMIVSHPELAVRVEHVDLLKTVGDVNIPVLIALIEAIQKEPGIRIAALMGRWQQEHVAIDLRPFFQNDVLLTDSHLEQQFVDTYVRLLSLAREQQLNNLLKKAKVMGLTASEKQQLQELLQK